MKVTIMFGFFNAEPARALTNTESVFFFWSKSVVHLRGYISIKIGMFYPSIDEAVGEFKLVNIPQVSP